MPENLPERGSDLEYYRVWPILFATILIALGILKLLDWLHFRGASLFIDILMQTLFTFLFLWGMLFLYARRRLRKRGFPDAVEAHRRQLRDFHFAYPVLVLIALAVAVVLLILRQKEADITAVGCAAVGGAFWLRCRQLIKRWAKEQNAATRSAGQESPGRDQLN